MYVHTYIYIQALGRKHHSITVYRKLRKGILSSFCCYHLYCFPLSQGPPRLSLSFLRITRSVCSAPNVPCSVPLHGNPLSSQVSGLHCLLGFIHLWIMIVSFFFFNSCPLSSFCIFRETSFTIGGYPYLVINLNIKAFKDSPLVWGIVEVMKYLCSYVEILF